MTRVASSSRLIAVVVLTSVALLTMPTHPAVGWPHGKRPKVSRIAGGVSRTVLRGKRMRGFAAPAARPQPTSLATQAPSAAEPFSAGSLLPPLAPQSTAASDDAGSPTGPIALPVTGMLLDPLAPPKPEQTPSVQQPDSSQLPIFPPGGFFGTTADLTGHRDAGSSFYRATVTTGEGKVYVLSNYNGRVFVYDTANGLSETSFAAPSGTLRDIDYYDSASDNPELYVLYDSSGSKVAVYDTAGNLKRTLVLKGADNSGGFTGLDLGFGEIWATRAMGTNGDVQGAEVAVFDAKSGALKGQGRQPAGELRSPPPVRGWWDLSIAPEFGGAIVDHRLFSRAPSLGGLPIPNSPTCAGNLYLACISGDQRGTDAVPGMNWFLELVSYAAGGYRPVQEYSIAQRSDLRVGPIAGLTYTATHPGYYLIPKRSWTTKQQEEGHPEYLSDLAYQNRETRIDAYGYLGSSKWLNGNKCLYYVVSDADIYVIGNKGEHWFEPARGFQRIEFRFDGQLIETRSQSSDVSGTFCRLTTQYANRPTLTEGPHSLDMTAYLQDGKTVTYHNDIRIDNQPPQGTLAPVGQYLRGAITLAGTVTDNHSGPQDWQLQILRPGRNPAVNTDWETACIDSDVDPAAGVATCVWDTQASLGDGSRRYPDGGYQVRARVRDKASDAQTTYATAAADDDGNTATTASQAALVDNTPPAVADMAPDINETMYEAVAADHTSVDWTQTDNSGGSGVASTTLEANTAPDGSGTGAWEPIGTSSSGSSQSHLEWNLTDREGGLYRLRARACDKAGNCQSTEWQTDVVGRARRLKDCPENAGRHCYAGEDLGYPNPFTLSEFEGLGYALQADLTRAAPVAHQTAQDFSVNFINLGLGPHLQVGLTTPSPASHQENACGKVGSGPTDQWYYYEELVRGSKGFIYCYGPAAQGTRTYKVEITKPGDTYYARGWIGGKIQAIRRLGNRRVFWLGERGVAGLQVAGEVTNRSRELAGRFSNVLVHEQTQPGLGSPNYQHYFRDTGYERHGSATAFCVTDSRRKVAHGCQ
jgi:hypothetical protein